MSPLLPSRPRPGLRRALRATATAAALAAAMAVGAVAVPSAAGLGPTSTPPPTPVPGSTAPSPFPTVLRTPPPAPSRPAIRAAAAVVEDMQTGQVLYGRRARAFRPVASLTKIVTALIAMDRLRPSEVVSVRPEAAAQGGSRLGLRVGERISVRNLLYALLLQSSNDAAVALAQAVSGSVGRFVKLMNRTSTRLGATGTRFRSPSGLDDRGGSTAADLALLARTAMRSSLFARIVGTKTRDIPSPDGGFRHIQNRNALLWLYPGAIGVKTGMTIPAGNCLVAAARYRGRRVLVVVLGDPSPPFDAAASLLNYGLREFVPAGGVTAGEVVGVARAGGLPVPAVAAADLNPLVRLDRLPGVRTSFRPDPGLRLPVRAGQPVGEVVVSVGDKVVGRVGAAAAAAVSLSPRGATGALDLASVLIEWRLATSLLRWLEQAFL